MMKFSIGLKLWSSYIAILVVMIAVGCVSYWSINQLLDSARWVTHTYQVLGRLDNLLSALQGTETGVRGYLVTGEERFLSPYTQGVQQQRQYFDEIKSLTLDNPVQQRRLASLHDLIVERLAELQESKDLYSAKSTPAETARQVALADHGKQTMDAIRSTISDMCATERSLLKERDEEAHRNTDNAIASIVGGIGLASLIVVGAGLLLTRNISRPLVDITAFAQKISLGDLSGHIAATRRRDEVGILMQAFATMTASLQDKAALAQQIATGDLTVSVKPASDRDLLAQAFQVMIDNLRKVNQEVVAGVTVLSGSVSEIMAGTNQLAVGATETASAITETTTTVEEVKQTAKLSSQKAKYVSETAQQAAHISETGRKAVEESIEGIEQIRAQMSLIADSIVQLSEQSQAIGEIIATVNDLSEQSNLLAVNASIEAARAGEQGRGFAVVAQEVKNLAEQSKQATVQVRAILGQIQKATTRAVLATEQGSKSVEAGTKQSRRAGDAITQLSESIIESAQAANQIAVSAHQQLTGMDQLSIAMESIKVATVQNAESTRQAEIAANNLHGLGLKLKTLVERYRV